MKRRNWALGAGIAAGGVAGVALVVTALTVSARPDATVPAVAPVPAASVAPVQAVAPVPAVAPAAAASASPVQTANASPVLVQVPFWSTASAKGTTATH